MGFPRRRSGNRQSGSSQTKNETKNAQNKKTTSNKPVGVKSYAFQLHGQQTKQTCTYSKVLENLILKIQASFKNPNLIVKNIREEKKNEPAPPTRVRDKPKKNANEDQLAECRFQQQTHDMEYRVDLEE